MNTPNPYSPPEANLIDGHDMHSIELASLWQRLGAAILDGIVNLISVGPLMYSLGFFEYVKEGKTPSFMFMLGMQALSFLMFVVVHSYFLLKNGQTIGKKIVGIRITDMDDNIPALPTILGIRYLPVWLVTLIPGAGNFLPFIDALFIFRSDRRCIHDLMAGTKVVQVKK